MVGSEGSMIHSLRYLSAPTHPMRTIWKFLFVLVLILAGTGYVRYFWVFGTGVKSGELNYLVHKGVLFKTYEGKMIQTGIRSQQGSFQSFEFLFSVEDPVIAKELMVNSGSQFNLHYREYLGALPWRGHSAFVVDSIVSMEKVAR
jgi:hypothetical protein